jgi:hypothetical protein
MGFMGLQVGLFEQGFCKDRRDNSKLKLDRMEPLIYCF